MSFAALLKGLNKWLFEPTSPTPIALARICIGLILLQNLVLHLLPDFYLYYGNHAIISMASATTKYWGDSPIFNLMLILPDDERWRLAFFILIIVATVFMVLGLFSRVSMVVVFLGMLSFDNMFELNQNDGDVFLRLVCMILAFSNAGDAFSLDNLLRSFREDWRLTGFGPRLAAPWAQRWYQLQLAFVYCHTFFAKASGKHWIDGWAVYFASRYDDCQRFMMPIIFDNPFILKCLTWSTLVIEGSLWTLIWFKEFRYWVLLGGLCLHMGIECTMNLPMFEWLFMSSYFVFVEPEDLRKVMDFIKVKVHTFFGAPVLLAFDGQTIAAVRAVGLLHRLDIFGFLDLIDFRSDDFATEIVALPPDLLNGGIYLQHKVDDLSQVWLSGFAALQWMSLRLPFLWLLLPLLYIPFVNWFAEKIYHCLASKGDLIFGNRELGVTSQ